LRHVTQALFICFALSHPYKFTDVVLILGLIIWVFELKSRFCSLSIII